jgi:alpha-tubulin suppressor-like RCC1 family protein
MPAFRSGVEAFAPVPRFAAGHVHSIAIDADGSTWSFGDNTSGQLGIGSTASRSTPALVRSASSGSRSRSVAAGDSHSLLLLADGSLLAFGANDRNALSTGSTTSKLTRPTPVLDAGGRPLAGVVAIAAGGSGSAAILQNGTAVVWGKGLRPSPVRSPDAPSTDITGIAGIAAGTSLVVVLKTDGSVLSCPSSRPDQATPVLRAEPGSAPVPLTGIVAVSAGKSFAVALSADGRLFSWGSTAGGVLGRDATGSQDPIASPVLTAAGGRPLSGVTAVDCGPDHVVAVLSGGSMMGWGSADSGRLGPALSGTLPYPVPLGLSGLSGVTAVSCGGRHVLAGTAVGALLAFGANGQGQTAASESGISEPHTIYLTDRLWRTSSPSLRTASVTDVSIGVTWRSQDLYEENTKGFIVRWSRPDGTNGATMRLPASVRGVVLGNLQSSTNHTIRIAAIGADGQEEEAPPIVVQTKPGITPSPGVEPTTGTGVTPGEATPTAAAAPTDGPGSGRVDLGDWINRTLSVYLTYLIEGAAILAVLAMALKVLIWIRSRGDLVEDDRNR